MQNPIRHAVKLSSVVIAVGRLMIYRAGCTRASGERPGSSSLRRHPPKLPRTWLSNLLQAMSDVLQKLESVALKALQAIAVRRPGAFRRRSIVIGETTIADVFQRYGTPTHSTRSGTYLILSYADDGIDFVFPFTGTLRNRSPVSEVIVHAGQPLASGTRYPSSAAR